MTTFISDHDNTPTTRAHRPGGWVVYFSADRQILWADEAVRDVTRLNDLGDLASFRFREEGQACPLAVVSPNPALDATFATRQPQATRITVREAGKNGKWSIRAFPHFDVEGEFAGVIQLAEPVSRRASDETGTLRHDIENPFDYALAGILVYNPLSDVIVAANRRIVQQTGYSAAEFEHLAGEKIFRADQLGMLKHIFHRMIRAGEGMLWGQTFTLLDSKGRERNYFCSLRALPERREPGSPILMCVSVDPHAVDDRDAELREPSRRFVTEALENGLWVFDFDTRKFHYSLNSADLFGLDGALANFGVKPLDDFLEQIHPADAETVFHTWRQFLNSGANYRTQYRIRNCAGEWRWVLSTIHAIINDRHGNPRKILGMHMDFTGAMRAEKNLIDAETQLRMIFENAGFGIAVTDLGGTVWKVNPAMALILRREVDELVGHRLVEYALSEDIDGMTVMLDRLIRGGRKRIASERRFRTGDGRVIWGRLAFTISENELDGSKSVVVLMEDITERMARQQKLQYNANHDALTGAWSRGALMERLSQHVNLALRYSQPLTFCICDLDHFKRVNDVHGHQAGDKVLVKFVKILTRTVRETDVVGRYGGEEFGVVFPNTSMDGAAAAMDRARQLLSETEFRNDTGGVFRTTATFGLAEMRPGGTANTMIAEADSALYRGKRDGRNQVVVFDPERGE